VKAPRPAVGTTGRDLSHTPFWAAHMTEMIS
jgi:hypothetical protein